MATRFLNGAAMGGAILAVAVLGLAAAGDLSATAAQIPMLRFIGGGLFWALASLFVAAAQEGVFRGWGLAWLAKRLGFYRAALTTSLCFAASHVFSPGATMVSLASLLLFGLIMAFWVRAEGALWGVVGFHAAWDFVLSFVMGSGGGRGGGSGLMWRLTGPAILTGGRAGLEGALPVLVLLALFVVWMWRRDAQGR